MSADDREQIRLSGTSYAVLSVLEALGPATPYDLKQVLEHSIENFWQVPHTTAYAEPARLARGGYLTERQDEGGRRRKVYTITERGREELREWTASTEISDPQLREEGVLKIFAGADPLPIIASRRQWHAGKLSELEGYLAEVEGPAGVRASLMVGVSYHRMLVEAMDRWLEAQAATGSS